LLKDFSFLSQEKFETSEIFPDIILSNSSGHQAAIQAHAIFQPKNQTKANNILFKKPSQCFHQAIKPNNHQIDDQSSCSLDISFKVKSQPKAACLTSSKKFEALCQNCAAILSGKSFKLFNIFLSFSLRDLYQAIAFLSI
jgi:hypothetical protein